MHADQALEVEAPPTTSSSLLRDDEELETRSSKVFASLASHLLLTQAALASARNLCDLLMHGERTDESIRTLLMDLLGLLETVDDYAGTSEGRIAAGLVDNFSIRLQSLLSGLHEPVSTLLTSTNKHFWLRAEREERRLRQLGRLRSVLDEFERSIEPEWPWSFQFEPYGEAILYEDDSDGITYNTTLDRADDSETEEDGYVFASGPALPDRELAWVSQPTPNERFHEILHQIRTQVAGPSLDESELLRALTAAVAVAEISLSQTAPLVVRPSQAQQPYHISSLPALQAAYIKCLTIPQSLGIAVTSDAMSIPDHAASSILDSLHEAAKPLMAPTFGLPMTALLNSLEVSHSAPSLAPSTYIPPTKLLASEDRAEKILRTNIRDLLVHLSFECGKFPSSLVLDGVTRLDAHAIVGGGHADVYRGMKGDIMVALKHLRAFTAEQRHRIRLRFYREVILWQYLDHPHVLRFLGLDDQQFPPHLCMVSPWMENGNLLQHTLACNLSIPQVNQLLYQTADGLQYLHEQQLIHGDLRCANVLVNEKGEACLADFGLTTLILESGIATGTSSVGSPRWSAPELFTAEPPLRTEATDIYALGCVCLELHTRQIPFADITGEHRVIFLLMTGKQLERPSRDRYPEADTSDSLWNVLEMCWSLVAASRPSLRTIKDALEAQTNLPLEPYSVDHQYINTDLVEQSVLGPRERTEDSVVESSV